MVRPFRRTGLVCGVADTANTYVSRRRAPTSWIWIISVARPERTPHELPSRGKKSLSKTVMSRSRYAVDPRCKGKGGKASRHRVYAWWWPAIARGVLWSRIPRADDLESIRAHLWLIPPLDFEHFIKTVMERSGFVSVSVTRASGDGGIDLDAHVDEANDFFSGTHVQAQVKRWRHAVGSPDLNSFRGALSTTAKGLFVTTSSFTRAALAEARHSTKPCISLIDGLRLSAIVMRLNLTV